MMLRVRVLILALFLVTPCISAFASETGAPISGRTADSDNSFGTATALVNNTQVAGNVNTADDTYDYYKLAGVQSGQTLRVIASCAAPTTLSVTIYTEGGTSVGASAGHRPTCNALATTNGTYYVTVRAVSGQSDYTLTVTLGYPETLTPGVPVSASLSLDGDDWNRWYRVWLNGNVSGMSDGVFINITIANMSSFFSVYCCDILNFNSTRIYNESWTVFAMVPMGFAATATGWYYYYVRSLQGMSAYTLTTASTSVPCDGDSALANCTEARHKGVYDNRYIDKAWDHYDWYSYRVRTGDSLTIRADQLDTQHLFNMTVYDSALRYLNGSTNQASLSTVAFINMNFPSVPANDTYYIYLSPVLWVKNPPPGYSVSDQNAWLHYKLTFTSPDHPPQVLAPVDDLSMDEDTVRDIDTTSHFQVIDEGALNITGNTAHINTTFNATSGILTIAPRANWFGKEQLDLSVKDSWSTLHQFVNVTVQSVNDVPYVKKQLSNITMAQGGVDTSIELNLTFGDNDTTYGDRLDYAVSGNGSLRVDIAQNGKVTLTDPATFFGNLTLTFTATDNASVTATAICNVSVYHMNQPPHVKKAPSNITLLEDEAFSLDLSGAFEDPEGDPITLIPAGNQKLKVSLDPNTLVANISASPNEAGFSEDLTFTARDDRGLGDELVAVHVTVVPVNDAPRITSSTPKGDVTMNEGDSMQFNISASDVETPLVSLNFTWYIDGKLVARLGQSTLFSTNYTSAGNHTVKVVVDDGELNATRVWNITVLNANRDPTDIRILTPIAGQQFREGANVTFEGTASDPDGDPLTFTWLEGTRELGTGKNVTVQGLAAGTHNVLLAVWDGTATVQSRAVSFVIKADILPKIISTKPLPNQRFQTGKKIDFSVAASDEDGDALSYTWTREGQTAPLSTSMAFSVSNLPAGTHIILLSVSDGRGFANVTIPVTVYTPESPNSNLMGVLPFAIAGIVIVALMAILITREMKRKRPQAPAEMPPPPPPVPVASAQLVSPSPFIPKDEAPAQLPSEQPYQEPPSEEAPPSPPSAPAAPVEEEVPSAPTAPAFQEPAAPSTAPAPDATGDATPTPPPGMKLYQLPSAPNEDEMKY